MFEFKIGDTLLLKKVHPCGHYDWVVRRVGADIRIKCNGCGRRVLLSRSDLARRTKQITPKRQGASQTSVNLQ